MFKKCFFLLIIIFTCCSLNALDIFLDYLNPEHIRQRALHNYYIDKTLREKAEKEVYVNEEYERTRELVTSLINFTSYLLCNTAKFGFKLLTDTKRTLIYLNSGHKNVVAGCIGFTTMTLLTIMYYLKKKEQEQRNIQDNENARQNEYWLGHEHYQRPPAFNPFSYLGQPPPYS